MPYIPIVICMACGKLNCKEERYWCEKGNRFLAVLMISCALSGCAPKIPKLSGQDMKNVEIWTHTNSRELTEDEILNFIQLYNASSYGAKLTGEGGTPDFGLRFTLVGNETQIILNDFYGKLEPAGIGVGRYIESAELYEFIGNLAKTI